MYIYIYIYIIYISILDFIIQLNLYKINDLYLILTTFLCFYFI